MSEQELDRTVGRRLCRFATVGVCGLAWAAAGGWWHLQPIAGQDPAVEPASTRSADMNQLVSAAPATDQQREWLRLLGSDAFRQRERAAEALLEQGVAARAVLMEGLRNPDLEVRLRAHYLLQRILQTDFEAQIQAFVQGAPDALEPAGWPEFRDILGDERETRSLYADMLRRESPLLHAIGKEDLNLPEVVSKRIEELMDEMRRPGMLQPLELPKETLASLLFAVDNAVNPAGEASLAPRISTFLQDANARRNIQQGRYSRPMLKLLRRWITQQDKSPANYSGLQVALMYEMTEEGLDLARKTLQRGDDYYPAIQYASIMLGRFGNAADVPLLEAHLDNSTNCHTWHNAAISKNPIQIQVRDVTLAMAVHALGKDPVDFGYKHLVPSDTTLYQTYSMCFVEADEREAALKKWHEVRHPDRAAADKPNQQEPGVDEKTAPGPGNETPPKPSPEEAPEKAPEPAPEKRPAKDPAKQPEEKQPGKN